MNVTLEIKAPDLAAAINNLAAAIAGRTGETVVGVTEPEKQKAARSAAKPSPKTEPSTPDTGEAKQEPTPTEAAEADQSASGEADAAGEASQGQGEADAVGGLAYDDVKKAVFNVSKEKGRDAVVSLLTDFDVDVAAGQKADVIPEARWADFIAEAQKVLGE